MLCRVGELEAEIQHKSNDLSAAENRIRELYAQVIHEESSRKVHFLQQYEQQHSPVSRGSSQGFDEFSIHGNNNMIDELSTELRKALDKRRTLEQQVNSLTQELQQCRDRVSSWEKKKFL